MELTPRQIQYSRPLRHLPLEKIYPCSVVQLLLHCVISIILHQSLRAIQYLECRGPSWDGFHRYICHGAHREIASRLGEDPSVEFAFAGHSTCDVRPSRCMARGGILSLAGRTLIRTLLPSLRYGRPYLLLLQPSH